MAFEEQLVCWELSFTVGFVVLDLSSVETAISSDEECSLAMSQAMVETPLVDGPIIVNDASEPVRHAVPPISFVVGTKREQVVEF